VESILSKKILATRQGTLFVGIGAAVLAGILLLVYISRYRSSLNSSAEPITVLVAKRFIHTGTSGTVIGTQDLFQITRIRRSQVSEGAVTDPAQIRDRVAVNDIYPSQQMTLADFSATTTNALPTKLTRTDRAISIPIDTTHGLVGQLQAGDHVDVYVGMNFNSKPIIKLLKSNVEVLSVPAAAVGGLGSSSGGSTATLKISTTLAPRIAYAADNGRLWLIMRPQSGATPSKSALVDARATLFGVPSVGP
jgi:Flp pilus assembly protein CpaB